MQILFASDIHVSEDQSKRLPDLQGVFKQILTHLASIQPAFFIILGDVFDKRRPTPREMQAFNRFIMSAREYAHQIIILEGNHDADNGVSALSYFKDLGIENIRIVTPPYKFFPHGNGKGFYLGHEQIDGAKADNGLPLHGGLTLSKMVSENSDCGVFAFGHLHSPQVLKAQPLVFYAGSINPVSFAEREDAKRLWLFDVPEIGSVTYDHIYLYTRPMLQFDVEVIAGEFTSTPWLTTNVATALVKVVLTGTTEALKGVDESGLKKLIVDRLGANSLTVMFRPSDRVKPRNEAVSESATKTDILSEYFKQHENKDTIIAEGNKIIKEVDNG